MNPKTDQGTDERIASGPRIDGGENAMIDAEGRGAGSLRAQGFRMLICPHCRGTFEDPSSLKPSAVPKESYADVDVQNEGIRSGETGSGTGAPTEQGQLYSLRSSAGPAEQATLHEASIGTEGESAEALRRECATKVVLAAVPKDAITQQVQIVGDYAPDESFCEFVEQTRSQYDDTCRQLAAEVNRLRKALRSLLASAGEREGKS